MEAGRGRAEVEFCTQKHTHTEAELCPPWVPGHINRYTHRLNSGQHERLLRQTDRQTDRHVHTHGFKKVFTDNFLRPFLEFFWAHIQKWRNCCVVVTPHLTVGGTAALFDSRYIILHSHQKNKRAKHPHWYLHEKFPWTPLHSQKSCGTPSMDNQIIGEKYGSNLSQLLELEPLGICLYRKNNTSAWLGHSAQVFESNIILDISVNYRPETNSGR